MTYFLLCEAIDIKSPALIIDSIFKDGMFVIHGQTDACLEITFFLLWDLYCLWIFSEQVCTCAWTSCYCYATVRLSIKVGVAGGWGGSPMFGFYGKYLG